MYLVYTLYIVECIQVILASHDAYKVLGGGWGDIDALTKAHYQWIDSQMMTGIGAFRCSELLRTHAN